MRFLFRVDSSYEIGTGHVMRCLTLATALKEKGHDCIFISRNHAGNLISIIEQKGFVVYRLNQDEMDFIANDEYQQWLGVSEQFDAEQVVNLIANMNIDCCIVDHYGLSAIWENIIRSFIPKIVVIDDLANRIHNCDILLDQNYFENYLNRYQNLLTDNTVKLLGPYYCLLRNEFLKLRNIQKIKKENQILVNFGGVGRFNFLNIVLKAVSVVDRFNYVVITGQLNEEEYSFLLSKFNMKHIKILCTTENMPELMSESAFSIGACGSTVWERFCLGLNSALVEVANNQTELLQYLSKQALIFNLGSIEHISPQGLIDFLQQLNLDSERLRERSLVIQQLVDGLGVNRVVETILENVNA